MSTHVFNAIESEVFVRGDGIDTRVSVRAATTASVDFSTDLNSASVDGVSLSVGDRLLVKDQADVSEVTSVTCVADSSDSLNGTYFTINAVGTAYYVWFKTSGGALSDPAPAGKTGIQVNIATNALNTTVASAVNAALNAFSGGTVFSSSPAAAVLTVTNVVAGPVVAAADFDAGFTISRSTRGTSAIDNGIWEIASGAGATYRAEDLTTGDDAGFVFVDVQEGTAYEKTQWTCSSLSGSAVVDTDPLTWTMSSLFNYAANDLFLASSATEMTTLSTTADRVLVTDGSGNVSWSSNLPSGTTINGPFTTGTQIVNKSYVDGVSAGLDPKESVRLRTIDDVSGTYSAVGGTGGTGAFTAVDFTDAGNWDLDTAPVVTIQVGDRVLVMNQTDAKQNGIYVVTVAGAAGAMERAPDQDGSPANEVSGGNFTFTETGEVYAGTGWVVVHDGDLTLNTDDMVWSQFSTVGDWNASDGINIVGNIVSVDLLANGGVVFNGTTPNGKLQVDVGASAITGVLDETHGGTGESTYTQGDLLVGDATNKLEKLSSSLRKVLTTDNTGSGIVAWRNDVHLENILGNSALEPELVNFLNTNAAVNHLQIANALTAVNPKIKAIGDDANVGLDLMSKGTGAISVMGDTNPGEVRFWNEADTFYTALKAQTVAQGLTGNVSFCLPKADGATNDVMVTDGSGVLSFATLNAVFRQSHSLMALEVKANSTSLSPVAYFNWNDAEYGDVSSGKIFYEVNYVDRTLEIEVYNETTAASLGSTTHSASGFFSLVFTLPTADARLSIRVRKTGAGGANPTVFGVQMVFNPVT